MCRRGKRFPVGRIHVVPGVDLARRARRVRCGTEAQRRDAGAGLGTTRPAPATRAYPRMAVGTADHPHHHDHGHRCHQVQGERGGPYRGAGDPGVVGVEGHRDQDGEQ